MDTREEFLEKAGIPATTVEANGGELTSSQQELIRKEYGGAILDLLNSETKYRREENARVASVKSDNTNKVLAEMFSDVEGDPIGNFTLVQNWAKINLDSDTFTELSKMVAEGGMTQKAGLDILRKEYEKDNVLSTKEVEGGNNKVGKEMISSDEWLNRLDKLDADGLGRDSKQGLALEKLRENSMDNWE